MTLGLPDDPVTASFSPKDLLLELACALYARKRISMSQGVRGWIGTNGLSGSPL